MRLMSFSATTEQIRRQEKSETRRLGWADLKPGEVFCAIEKGQGLKKGETVNRLMILVCRSNRSEPLNRITTRAVRRKVSPDLTPAQFVTHFCELNRCEPGREVNVIRFDYVSRVCRVCGCWEYDGCPEGCWWVEPDLCSSCAPPPRPVRRKARAA